MKNLRTDSWRAYVYRISADEAEQYIRQDSIAVDLLVAQEPFTILPIDSVQEDAWPVGHYLVVSVRNNNILTQLIEVSNLLLSTLNNQRQVQLAVSDRMGAPVQQVRLWINDVALPYRPGKQSFLVPQKYSNNALVKVCTSSDTLFAMLGEKEEDGQIAPLWKQRLANFSNSRVMRTVLWTPRKVADLFRVRYRKKYPNYRRNYSGLMVFNQPKYRMGDTVRLKAYLFNPRKKKVDKPVNVFLEYRGRNQYHQQLLCRLEPSAPGSYIYAFPLQDTLINDLSYNIVFRRKEGQTLLVRSFKVEDYVLDEIGKYSMQAERERYYALDTLRFSASAKDANGLNLLDASAKLALLTSSVHTFKKDSLYVADTLLVMEQPLRSDSETVFKVPASHLPPAGLDITAVMTFKNSNNELHDNSWQITYRPWEEEFIATEKGDSIVAAYMVNGVSVPAAGEMLAGTRSGGWEPVRFPLSLRINPLAESYSFRRLEHGKRVQEASLNVSTDYTPTFYYLGSGDTLGFLLRNERAIPVSYTVLDGNKVIGEGISFAKMIVWKQKVAHTHRIYKVKWQYWWAGKEQRKVERIGVFYNRLDIRIANNPSVFPGQQDSISITVNDYKNRPQQGVDLTVATYNAQFKKDIYAADFPAMAHYRKHPELLRPGVEQKDVFVQHDYSLGQHQRWLKVLGLDTMMYYQMLFPAKSNLDIAVPVNTYIPQLSVHVVKKGVPQPVYLLYANRQLVYYNATDASAQPEAFSVHYGYTQVSIRLRDRFVEIDSIYIQSNYRHHLVFDLDNLPAHTTVTKVDTFYTDAEKKLLEQSMLQLDTYGQAYLWQGNKVAHMPYSRNVLLGPFVPGDSLHYYVDNWFDMHFLFEPGYQVRPSKQIVRLEKKLLFPDVRHKTVLPLKPGYSWELGDTITEAPGIHYTSYVPTSMPYLPISSSNTFSSAAGAGRLYLNVAADTSLRYVVLCPLAGSPLVQEGHKRELRLDSGLYTLLLVTNEGKAVECALRIVAGQMLCLNTVPLIYQPGNALLNKLLTPPLEQVARQVVLQPSLWQPPYERGNAALSGRVLDREGRLPVSGATVMIKGTTTGTTTAPDGTFRIGWIKAGSCTLVISSLGYKTWEQTFNTNDNALPDLELTAATYSLNDVVVVGFGTQNRTLRSYSIASVKSVSTGYLNLTDLQTLQGRVAGVGVSPGASYNDVRIRGVATIETSAPLYVVDEILYDQMPANISPENIASVNVIKDERATLIYGSRAANGVVVVVTKNKVLRTMFRDYATWQPQLFTDRNGRVKLAVTYPDNITGWEMYVWGMGRHKRSGRANTFIKSYKPLMAQLSMPAFLLEGDTVQLVGKAMNYAADAYDITTHFSLAGQPQVMRNTQLAANSSDVQTCTAIATPTDSLKAGFALTTSTGFNDAEERNIPIMKRGTEETQGLFWVLPSDTVLNWLPGLPAGTVTLHAESRALDVLLQELDGLRKYPFFCMEQTSSKLRGLLMEKEIRKALGQSFKDDQLIDLLTRKLEKAQHFDGGWGWWENETPDIRITNYVLQALLPLRADPLVATTLRNGLLNMQHLLPKMDWPMLLTTLLTMSKAGHQMDYSSWMARFSFDSLDLHQQWEYVKIKQLLKVDHARELAYLMGHSSKGMLGDLHWGTDVYQWWNNSSAATVLAFDVLQQEEGYEKEKAAIVEYFMLQRSAGHWRNTVESASIVSALLPYLLQHNANLQQPAELTISGDSSFTIQQFPYTTQLPARPVNIRKSGGGLVYLTLHQHYWNPKAESVTGHFNILTHFENNRQTITSVSAGEQIKLVVSIDVLQDADYVMFEIPIPAGCIYAGKSQDVWGMHKEFYRNKVVLFASHLNKGLRTIEVPLETRYRGNFTLNPAKASLMYFPTVYGRNAMKQVQIN